ncbi:DUF2235 domain-containing protein [Pseudomonas sp. ZM23]|uniref:DUF2235 domain-containing protein n=1 Tax=Pseudomonas triclosanedens TaxID=2961893 RepID=A0ABY6ZSF7_9PSED|nr:DUF2235 domain-containing protein [Pseudomonas triclosanedens]MCP8466998.1 DUF2235 domain-containing protein [Pseudomonas triclosanedens]MCP8472854.1 DUF2235 domain-containing protein [Pseudomonas triclosanedens]MCP8478285.1 DUF2235 domain-containing protein [Pseudomonas triclosanedens]WAI47690.1 DUF2235 domain-containing protein [Pseudomonas triclosanedens]
METAYLIFDGTGQNAASGNEHTVRLARELEAAGLPVETIAGPGTSDTVIRKAKKTDFDLARGELYPPAHEIPFHFDIIRDTLAGNFFGDGVYENVDEGVEKFKDLQKLGVTEVVMVGFSRGAVTAVLVARKLAELGVVVPGDNIRIKMFLLDPVPGPKLVAGNTLEIPKIVSYCYNQRSVHESRPFFDALNLTVEDEFATTLDPDYSIGVHGDVGGSTQSPVSTFNYLDLKRRLGLPVSTSDYHESILDAFDASSSVTNPGVLKELSSGQGFSRRPFGELHSGLSFPSDSALKSICVASEAIRIALANKQLFDSRFDDKLYKQFSDTVHKHAVNDSANYTTRQKPVVRGRQGMVFSPKVHNPIKIPRGGRPGMLTTLLIGGVIGAIAYMTTPSKPGQG